MTAPDKWKKYLRRGIISAIVLMTALLFGSVLLLKTNKVQQLILTRINALFPGHVSAEKIDFSFLKTEVTIEALSLKGPLDDQIVSIKHLYAELDFQALLNQQLILKNIRVTAPDIHFLIDENGQFNLLSALPPKREKKEKKKRPLPFNIIINRFTITNGGLSFINQKNGQTISAQDVELLASLDILKQKGEMDISIGEGQFKNNKLSTPINHLKIGLKFKNGDIPALSVNGESGFLNVAASGTIKKVFHNPSLDLKMDAGLSLTRFDQSLSPPKGTYSGDTKISATVKGPIKNPDIDISVLYSDGILFGMDLKNITLGAVLSDRMIRLSKGRITTQNGIIDIAGNINLKNAFPEGFDFKNMHPQHISYTATLKSNGLKFADIPFINKKEGVLGDVDISLALSGKDIKPSQMAADINFDLNAKNVQVDALKAPIDAWAKGDLTISDGFFNLPGINIVSADTTFHGEGNFDIKTKNFKTTLTLSAPELNRSLSPLGLTNFSGKLIADTTIAGENGTLSGVVLIESDELNMGSIRIGDMNATARMAENRLEIESINLQNRNSKLFVKGFVDLFLPGAFVKPNRNPQFSGTIQGGPIFIEDFIDTYSGKINLNGTFDGSKNDPKIDLLLNIKHLAAFGQTVEKIDLPIHISDRRLYFPSFRAEIKKGEKITGEGSISFDKTFDVKLLSEGISLSSIAKIEAQKIIHGDLIFDITAKGTFDDPSMTGKIHIKNIMVNDTPSDDFYLEIALKNQLATVDGTLNFDINGAYHLDSKDFILNLMLNQTSLTPYFSMIHHKELTGDLTGIIQADGNLQELNKLKGKVDFSHISLFFNDTPVIRSKNVQAFYENDNFSISKTQFALLNEGTLEISGTGNPNGEINLNAFCDLPLRILSMFFEDLSDITGEAEFNACAKGPFKSPDIKWDIALSEVQFTVPELYQKLRIPKGNIHITPEKIQITDISGTLDTGKFQLEGDVFLENFMPSSVSASFKAQTLPIKVPDKVDLLLNADLQLKGTEKKSMIEGDIVLLEGLYYQDIKLNPFRMAVEKSLTRRRSQAPIEKEIKQPFLKNMKFNINIMNRSPFIVDNEIASMEVNPDLNISGSINHPIINGRASVLSGKIIFQKRDFIINKGVIDFVNPYKIEPEIDIESQTVINRREKGELTIILSITGTPEELKHNLQWKSTDSQDEVLTESDLLSLIMFGKTNSELTTGKGGGGLSTAQIVAKLVNATISDDIKKTTGLDIFEVKVENGEETSTSENIKVTVGEEITKRLTMKYEIETEEGEVVQRGISEYRFLENFFLNGYQDTKGDFGTQMTFKLEFR